MVVRPPFTAGKGELMKKSARVSDIFLRVFLSLALVVSFVPIARDASYASEEGDAPSEVANAEDPNGDGFDSANGDGVDPINGNGIDSTTGETDTVADSEEGESPAESGSSDGGGSASGNAESQNDATQPGDSGTANGESTGAIQSQGVCEYAKLMSDGHTYECDASGNLKMQNDGENPAPIPCYPDQIVNLIVDSQTTAIPEQLFQFSSNLVSVQFKGETLESIEPYAFYSCDNLSSIDLSGMSVGSIEKFAFAYCPKLTSIVSGESATILSLGEHCFSNTGLVSTGLDKMKGLKSLPVGAYEGCNGLVGTSLGENQSVESVGDRAFVSCRNLESTGLGKNTNVSSIGAYAFAGCSKLQETGLGANTRITSIGGHAFEDCKSLRLSGLETNTTVSSLGDYCFMNTDMSGGLVLPSGSKITKLPKYTFAGTKLSFVYFQCDHAVLVDTQTFPSSVKKVFVPARSLDLYQVSEVKHDWEACFFDLPYDASNYLNVRIVVDPGKLTYYTGSTVFYNGMVVEFDYDQMGRTFDYADLVRNYAFSQFFSISPEDMSDFQHSYNGNPVRVTYNDGDHLINAYSDGLLQEEGSDALSVYVKTTSAQLGETVTGGGQFKQGDTCTVSAKTTLDGRMFAYWADEDGTPLSESATYTFPVKRSIVLTAVFADEVTVTPKARLYTAEGQEVEGVTFSIVADNCDHEETNYGETFVTYPGKKMTITCSYDSSKLTLDCWENLDVHHRSTWIANGDASITYTAEANETPVAILKEKQQPDPDPVDPGPPIDPVVAVHVNYSQTIDTGGRTLMDGVEVPNVSGSRFLFKGQFVALDAERLGMLDDDISFTGWYDKETGALISDKRVCLFKPDKDTNIEARFALKSTAVRINSAQSTDRSEAYAHVTSTVGNCYRDAGETVELSATTDNAQFRGWYEGPTGGQTLISDSLSCTYTVPVPSGETAQVEITPWYCAQQASVVLDVDGTTKDGSPQGSFLSTGLYGIGSSVTVVAIPAPYYVLDYVTDAAGNKVNVAENGSYTFTLAGDTRLTAHFRATSDGDEAFKALQAALIAILGVAVIEGSIYGIGYLVDPIALPAMGAIAEAETIGELVEIGEEALGKLEDIFEKHKHDRDPDKPKGDHTAEIIATAQPEAGGIVKGGGVHFEGTIAELDAIPNPGYRFVCWKEDGIERSTLPHMQMAITDATPDIVKLTAVFEKDATITTAVDVEGTAADEVTGCNATPDRQVVKAGTEATVVAVAGEGYEFAGWYDGVAEVSKTPTYTFVAETDRHLVAKFQRTCTVTVVVEPESALAGKYTVVGAGSCVQGKPTVLSVHLTEKSLYDKYTFKGWYRAGAGGDVLMGTDESHLEFVPEGDTVIRAEYVAKEYEIKVEVDGLITGINPHGEVSIMGSPGVDSVKLPYGRHVTIKATPSDKYWFAYWEDNSGKRYSDAELRVLVTKDETYTAVFKKGPEVVIAADSWLGGTVTCNGTKVKPDTDQFKLGEMLHLQAENNPGWLFWGWYENGLLVSTEKECTLVAESTKLNSYYCTITAAFKPLDVMCLPVASPAEGGSVTASRLLADRGADVVLKATPAPGYAFMGWYAANGELVSIEPEFTDKENRSHIYVAHFKECSYSVAATVTEATSSGELVENEAAGWVEGAGTYGANYPATLSAHAREGYTFKQWVDDKGAVVSTNADYRFVPSENTSLRAVFEAKSFTVDVATAEGYGTVSGAGTYKAGQEATVIATPQENATFIGWYRDGACVSTDATYRFTVSGDVSLTAVFGAGAYTVSAIASPVESGYTSGFGSFSKDDRTTLTAVAKPGFTFDCWKDAQGEVVSELPECTVAVSGDAAYVACFTRNSYYVELSENQEGAGVLSGGGTYAFGQVVELNARQTTDKRFVSWQLVGKGGEKTLLSTDAHCWFTLDEDFISSLIDNVIVIEAQFADPYEVSVSAKAVVSGKTGTRGCRVKGAGAYESGEKVTLQAIAGEGYRFAGWSLDEAGYVIESNDEVLSFNAASDAMYYAQFVPDKQVEVAVTQSSIFRGLTFIAGASGVGTSLSCDKGDAFVAMAVAYPGMRFSHWINDAGAVVSYNAIHVGIAHENMRLTAVFYETGFDAQVATYPAGAGFSMVIPGTSASYMGASVMITIPYPGWKFQYWADENGAKVGFSPLLVRPAYANRTFTAYYVRDVIEIVAIDPREGGHIEGSASYGDGGYAVQKTVEAGEAVTLHAVADDGYDFAGWYEYGKDGVADDAEPLSTDANWTFYPERDTKVIARFAEKPKLKVSATAENGTVAPSSVEVAPGGDATFKATPNENCYLARVSTTTEVAGGNDSATNDFDIADYKGGSYALTLDNVKASQALSFTFTKAEAPVVTVQPQSKEVREGDVVTLSVTADAAQSVLDHEEVSSGAAASHELAYQWYRVGEGGAADTAIEGATAATLSFDKADESVAGAYYCRITQSYLGTVTSVDSRPATISLAKPEELVFTACDLPVATAWTDYSASIEPATGGVAPYTYALAEGSSLPKELTLEVKNEDGKQTPQIVGEPERAGAFGFDIVCADSKGTAKTAHFTLIVKLQVANLKFEDGFFTYNGNRQSPKLSGVPEGLEGAVAYTYRGTGSTVYSSNQAPTDAGTYRVVATLKGNGYLGRATAEYQIVSRYVRFYIDAEDATYDGKAHGATVTVDGLESSDYSVTYRGDGDTEYGPTAQAPTNAGTYRVSVRTTNPNYRGGRSVSYKISPASQSIEGTTEYSATYGSAGFAFDNIAKTPVTFEVVPNEDGSPSPISVQGSYASVNAAGTARVIARAAASRNYLAADAELTVNVSPAQLLVVVNDAERVEGEANPPFTSELISPADTSGVVVAYSCEANEASPAGEYAINASVSGPNFSATVEPGTLTVTAKPTPDPGPDPDPDPGPGPVDPDNPNPPAPTPDPDNPDNPDQPDNPDGPDNPDNPDEPDNPDDPDEPNDPSNPNNPIGPDDPGQPDNPDNPSDPGNPSGPSGPVNPDNGQGDSDGPDNPGDSSNSNDPGKSGGQTDDAVSGDVATLGEKAGSSASGDLKHGGQSDGSSGSDEPDATNANESGSQTQTARSDASTDAEQASNRIIPIVAGVAVATAVLGGAAAASVAFVRRRKIPK